jgi:hypothetical protein
MIPIPDDLPNSYTLPQKLLRGGYRYVTISLSENVNDDNVMELSSINNYYTDAPNVDEENLRDLPGYFHSSDDLLNRIWYAGAYTTQLSTIGFHTGRVHNPAPGVSHWYNNAFITDDPHDIVLVDGAKRDRTVWCGSDYFVAIEYAFLTSVEQDSLRSVANGI